MALDLDALAAVVTIEHVTVVAQLDLDALAGMVAARVAEPRCAALVTIEHVASPSSGHGLTG
jgi:hypothetical protein